MIFMYVFIQVVGWDEVEVMMTEDVLSSSCRQISNLRHHVSGLEGERRGFASTSFRIPQ